MMRDICDENIQRLADDCERLEAENARLRGELTAANKKLEAFEANRKTKEKWARAHLLQTGTLKEPRKPVIGDD